MNTSQVNGIALSIVGKIQERAGRFFGNREHQMMGQQRQRIGVAEKNLGNARELIKNAVKQMHKSKQAMHMHQVATMIVINKNNHVTSSDQQLF